MWPISSRSSPSPPPSGLGHVSGLLLHCEQLPPLRLASPCPFDRGLNVPWRIAYDLKRPWPLGRQGPTGTEAAQWVVTAFRGCLPLPFPFPSRGPKPHRAPSTVPTPAPLPTPGPPAGHRMLWFSTRSRCRGDPPNNAVHTRARQQYPSLSLPAPASLHPFPEHLHSRNFQQPSPLAAPTSSLHPLGPPPDTLPYPTPLSPQACPQTPMTGLASLTPPSWTLSSPSQGTTSLALFFRLLGCSPAGSAPMAQATPA